jgi:hypothetical protein
MDAVVALLEEEAALPPETDTPVGPVPGNTNPALGGGSVFGKVVTTPVAPLVDVNPGVLKVVMFIV